MAAVLAGFWVGIAFTDLPPKEIEMKDPVYSARAYVFSHYRQRFSAKGPYLHYWISDHGDAWLIEVANQDEVGGGVRLMVIKQTGVTKLLGFTQ